MKLIKFTSIFKGAVIYVNPECVTHVVSQHKRIDDPNEPDGFRCSKAIGSQITLRDNAYVEVVELPGEVVERLTQATYDYQIIGDSDLPGPTSARL